MLPNQLGSERVGKKMQSFLYGDGDEKREICEGSFAKAASKLGCGKVICGLPQTQSVLCFVQGKMLLT